MRDLHRKFSELAKVLDESLIIELIHTYKEQMNVHIPELVKYCEVADYEKAKFLSHKLKSSSRNVGSHALAELFSNIEMSPTRYLNTDTIKNVRGLYSQFLMDCEGWPNRYD